MNKYQHNQNCNAPICAGDKTENWKHNVVWYAGEEVCQKVPFTKFQKKQIDINKWVKKGMFKNIDVPYTAHELETRSI